MPKWTRYREGAANLNDLFVNVVAIHFNVDPKLDILFGAA